MRNEMEQRRPYNTAKNKNLSRPAIPAHWFKGDSSRSSSATFHHTKTQNDTIGILRQAKPTSHSVPKSDSVLYGPTGYAHDAHLIIPRECPNVPETIERPSEKRWKSLSQYPSLACLDRWLGKEDEDGAAEHMEIHGPVNGDLGVERAASILRTASGHLFSKNTSPAVDLDGRASSSVTTVRPSSTFLDQLRRGWRKLSKRNADRNSSRPISPRLSDSTSASPQPQRVNRLTGSFGVGDDLSHLYGDHLLFEMDGVSQGGAQLAEPDSDTASADTVDPTSHFAPAVRGVSTPSPYRARLAFPRDIISSPSTPSNTNSSSAAKQTAMSLRADPPPPGAPARFRARPIALDRLSRNRHPSQPLTSTRLPPLTPTPLSRRAPPYATAGDVERVDDQINSTGLQGFTGDQEQLDTSVRTDMADRTDYTMGGAFDFGPDGSFSSPRYDRTGHGMSIGTW